MKESSWDDCLQTNSSLKVSLDKSKANSLIDTAIGRNNFLDSIKLTEDNSNYIFEGYYSSASELIHALLFLNGFKVTNHICLGYYLRDVLQMNDLFRLFDDCRFKRNSLVYYGKRMDFETAREAINKAKRLMSELNKTIRNLKT